MNQNNQPYIVSLVAPNLAPVSSEDPVFTKDQEDALEQYLQVFYTKTNYGIDGPGVRKLAYEVAILNNLKIPNSWKSSRMATEKWLQEYQYRRHLARVT